MNLPILPIFPPAPHAGYLSPPGRMGAGQIKSKMNETPNFQRGDRVFCSAYQAFGEVQHVSTAPFDFLPVRVVFDDGEVVSYTLMGRRADVPLLDGPSLKKETP
jgi:hypothetical protein